jgi:hypothetical protein
MVARSGMTRQPRSLPHLRVMSDRLGIELVDDDRASRADLDDRWLRDAGHTLEGSAHL